MECPDGSLKRLRLLDPSAFGREPFVADSVRIPSCELAARVSELPPPTETTRIANVGVESSEAAAFLRDVGRPVELVEDFEFVESPMRGRLWEPNPFLAETLPEIEGQTAIDIGSGGARDSVFLVDAGWKVCALDRLASSAAQGARLAGRYLLPGTEDRLTFLTDSALSFETKECFDLGLLFFWWTPLIVPRLVHLIRPGGLVLLEAFTEVHRREFGRPKVGYVVDENELFGFFANWRPLEMRSGWHRGRHTVQAALRRPL